MGKPVADGFGVPYSKGGSDGVQEVQSEGTESKEEQEEVTVIHTGGGWYKITHADGTEEKVQGREAAYSTAGIEDPEDEE